jgi:predicted RNA-binding protein
MLTDFLGSQTEAVGAIDFLDLSDSSIVISKTEQQ